MRSPSKTYNFIGTRSQDEMLHVAVLEKRGRPETAALIPKNMCISPFRVETYAHPCPTRTE